MKNLLNALFSSIIRFVHAIFCSRPTFPLLLILLLTSQAHPVAAVTCSGGNEFYPEAVGKVKAPVEKGSYSNYYRLSSKGFAPYDQKLQKVLDVILAQPHLKPPYGTNVDGVLRGWESPHCSKEPCTGIPVAGQGFISYYYFLNFRGKMAPIVETQIHFDIAVNNLDSAIGGIRPFAEGMRDLSGREIYFQMRQQGEIDGVPVYMHGGKGLGILVITPSKKPWWKPLSREEFLKAAIRDLEVQVAKEPPISDTPAADAYRNWQKERSKRQKEAKKLLEEMKRQDPAMAETLRKTSEKMETDMTESYRKNAGREAERHARAEKSGPRQKALTMDDRLQRHREVLAAMLPVERKLQAIYLVSEDPLDPPLAKPDLEGEGSPMVTANPDFFDKKLPRTAIQIISLRFGYHYLDPIKPDEFGCVNPGFRAMWQTIQDTPWSRIRSQLGK